MIRGTLQIHHNSCPHWVALNGALMAIARLVGDQRCKGFGAPAYQPSTIEVALIDAD